MWQFLHRVVVLDAPRSRTRDGYREKHAGATTTSKELPRSAVWFIVVPPMLKRDFLSATAVNIFWKTFPSPRGAGHSVGIAMILLCLALPCPWFNTIFNDRHGRSTICRCVPSRLRPYLYVTVSRQLSIGENCSLSPLCTVHAICARHVARGGGVDGFRTEHRCFFNTRTTLGTRGYQDMRKRRATIPSVWYVALIS